MNETADPLDTGSLQLSRVDIEQWVVHDWAFAIGDARHVVARVRAAEEDEVEVVWVHGDIPLPTRYREASDVVEDLARWRSRQIGMTRPIEIPHLRPIGG